MAIRRTAVVLLAGLTALASAAACGDDAGAGATLTVLAAASLTDAFADLADAFEATVAEMDVEVSVGASSALREQILAGAPADVFAAADRVEADRLAGAGAAGGPAVVVARNAIELVVPAGNPAGVRGIADLSRRDLLVGLCAAEVPCGRLARAGLDRAGVDPAVDTEAPDVRALLTQVAAGELDVGIAYRTDVLAAPDEVDGISIDGPAAAAAEVALVVVADAHEPDLARALVAFVRSPSGQRILAEHGFGPP